MKKFMSLLVFGVCAFVLFSKSVLAENDNLWNDFVNEFKTGKGYEELKDSLKSGSVSVTSTDNSLTVSYDNDGNISTSTLMYEDGVITLKEIENLTYDNLDLNSSVVINAVTAYAELNNLDSEKVLAWFESNDPTYEKNGMEYEYESIQTPTEYGYTAYSAIGKFKMNIQKGKLVMDGKDYSKPSSQIDDETKDELTKQVNNMGYIIFAVCIGAVFLAILLIIIAVKLNKENSSENKM